MKCEYNAGFFDLLRQGSTPSARHIVPMLLHLFKPSSVVDVGCGEGAWLSVYRELGVDDVFGFDGPWVNKERLLIPGEKFAVLDLPCQSIPRRFDLAMCLEVAEHLPEKDAENLVDFLCRLSDNIVFSAAIPGQDGVGHVNEQWPEYWDAFFRKRGFVAKDCLRWQIWNNPKIDWWYRQNLLVYTKSTNGAESQEQLLTAIHPERWKAAIARLQYLEREFEAVRDKSCHELTPEAAVRKIPTIKLVEIIAQRIKRKLSSLFLS
ncbi:MAG TPA: methyltransferase domain-containing protein [Candidatus Obscuribacterales bacterium]